MIVEPPGDTHMAEGVLANKRLFGVLKNFLANTTDAILRYLVHKEANINPHSGQVVYLIQPEVRF